MSAASIERDFHAKVSKEIRLHAEGVNRYVVFTPFMFDDGDHPVIVLKKEGERWMLSDEANTYMRLTYDISEKDLHGGTRQKIISDALSMFEVDDRDGELILPVPDGRYGDALYSFVQAILKISDVSFLTRERVRSAFMDDFRALMKESVPDGRMEFDWSDAGRDPQKIYTVDCRINGMPRPIFVHALANDGKTRDATIALLEFERWGIPYRSLAIFEDQESINRKVLARFSNVCEKQYSSIPANRERIARYLAESISA